MHVPQATHMPSCGEALLKGARSHTPKAHIDRHTHTHSVAHTRSCTHAHTPNTGRGTTLLTQIHNGAHVFETVK